MSRQLVQRIFKLVLFATAIQIAAATVTMDHIPASYEQLNKKLDDLQKKLDAIDCCKFSESLQISERHHEEKMQYLQILERQEKDTTEIIKKIEGHQKKTIESLQILERQEKKTSKSLKKFEERQKETTEALKKLKRQENETSESLKNLERQKNETSESLKNLERQKNETSESLKNLDRQENETLESLGQFGVREKETTALLQILGHPEKETTDSLKKLDDHQTETTASVQILEQHLNETTQIPASCVEVFKGAHQGSGVYKIDLPKSGVEPFEVYCLEDPKGGLPWTVVQRRVDGSTDFYRVWAEYQSGFGSLKRNFFIGLDKLHQLTNENGPQELWVKLTDNVTAHAYYDRFAIDNEANKYALHLLGTYSGDAGDALEYHTGMEFTTRDVDNDKSIRNCAQMFKGAWWYNDCQICNLNGVYGSTELLEGVNWLPFRGYNVPLKYTHMAIRPAQT